jgi:phosphate transport system substrate-binding protein
MKRKGIALLAVPLAALAVVAGAGASRQSAKDVVITGAGSTFVAPLVSVWTPALGSAFGYTIQYSAVGSGAGIAAISARTVDFGASDAPLTPDQFSACNGCVQIPWALAGTAVDVNLPGLVLPRNTNLRLTGEVIAKIYLGEITRWTDPAIEALNPKATIPDLPITVAHRSDNSGTTYNFTDYLSSVSPAWRSQVGRGIGVSWPVGVGANGNSGVAGIVKNTPGAIGYTDTAYALANGLRFAAIENRAGRFIVPSIRNVLAAGDAVKTVPAGNEMHIVNPPRSNPTAYPISTYTYVILPTKSPKAAELRKMVFWALTQGQQAKYTAKLWFVPIPKVVLVAAEKTLKQVELAT